MTVKSRRQDYAESTRAALLQSARHLFVQDGFTDTSLEEVAVHARLTKGAVYHHFASKKDLFEHVLLEINSGVLDKINRLGGAHGGDAWTRLTSGLELFLDACLDVDYQQICLRQAPSVLGWERCRELESDMRATLDAMLASLAASEEIRVPTGPLLTRMLYRMLSEGAMAIGEADHPQAARIEVGDIARELLLSLRSTPLSQAETNAGPVLRTNKP